MSPLDRLVARLAETVLPREVLERLRDGREWAGWIGRVNAHALEDLSGANAEQKRSVFKSQVRLVEIETHARCNRICAFCPNVIVDRRRNRTRASDGLLASVFDQLGSIQYAGQIKVARYSEPLADFEWLLECLRSARRRVPTAELAIVTNTDYLTRDRLELLKQAGLNTAYMSLYLKDRERWTLALGKDYSDRLGQKLGLRTVKREETPVSVRDSFRYPGLTLRSACMDFTEYGTDRGGAMEQYAADQRQGPCREPFETFVIDYSGAVVPCCNVRSDLPAHAGLVVGDLASERENIFDVYAGALSAWRRSMVGVGPKAFPCTTCRHREAPVVIQRRVARELRRRLAVLGSEQLYSPMAEDRSSSSISSAPSL